MQMNIITIVMVDDMKRPEPFYDFKAFGEAIKEAWKKRRESRNKTSLQPQSLPALPCQY